jgi:hypothetical protein
LPLLISLLIGVVLVILFFSLSMIRMVGSHQEQKTSIEAAALAGANCLSRIVIEDPNFGLVSLSDSPPVGTATAAGDNYYVEVRSISSILATVRLDMIIADKLKSSAMQQYARTDYQNALAAHERLLNAIKAAVAPGATSKDKDGNLLSPYQEAVNAYNSNCMRMNGGTASLVPGSFKLTLGWADKLMTNTQVPTPMQISQVKLTQEGNRCYLPFINIPCSGSAFIFPAVSDDSDIVDLDNYHAGAPDLPYSLPDIVRCDADEQFQYKDEYGRTQVETTHIAACAEPPCLVDHNPNPGALSIAFSAGMIPDIAKPGDLLLNTNLKYAPCDYVQSPLSGDYPQAPLTQVVLPGASSTHPALGTVMNLAIYDWIRRQRTNIDVASLINAFNQPFNAAMPANLPQDHRYEAQSGGSVTDTVVPDSGLALPISQRQYQAISGIALYSLDKRYFDVFVKDFDFAVGRTNGGIHAGEPFGGSTNTMPGPTSVLSILENPVSTQLFPLGPAGGAARPTYAKMGVAVQVRFRQRTVSTPTG